MNPVWLDILTNFEGIPGFLCKLTILLSAVWLIHLSLRHANPQWRVYLWRFTGIGSLVLAACIFWGGAPRVTLPLPLPAINPSQNFTANLAPRSSENNENLQAQNTTSAAATSQNNPAQVKYTSSPNGAPTANILTNVSAFGLALCWLAGVLVGGCYLVFGFLRLRKTIQTTQLASDRILAYSNDIATRIGLRHPPLIRVSTSIASPVLIWFGKPILLLPGYLTREQDPDQLSAVLGHELAHVNSRDLFWNIYLGVLHVLLWFHPLVWSIRRAHMESCELIADSVAARLMDNTREYQGIVAEVALREHGPLPHTGLAFIWKNNVRKRLDRLPETLKQLPIRQHWLAVSLIFALLAVTVIAGSTLIPSRSFTGTVYLSNGTPAADANIYVATSDSHVSFFDGDLESADGKYGTITDKAGHFHLPEIKEWFKLVIVHQAGTRVMSREEWKSGAPLTLQSWGRIEGRMTIGGQPVSGQKVGLNNLPLVESTSIQYADVKWHHSTPLITDDQGRFTFERVAAGTYQCSRLDQVKHTFVMPAKAVRVIPGQSTKVELQQEGQTIEGRIDWSAMSIPFRKDPFMIQEIEDTNWYPDFSLSADEKAEAMYRFWSSGRGIPSANQFANRHLVRSDEKGNFSVDHLRPGKYKLCVYSYPKDDNDEKRYQQLGGAARTFEVMPQSSSPLETLNLGTIKIVPNRASIASIGDYMPDIPFKLSANQQATSLEKYMGKPLIVSYGTHWLNPDYLSGLLNPNHDIRIIQLEKRYFGSPPPQRNPSSDPRIIQAYVGHSGMETRYLLGAGGYNIDVTYLINEDGIIEMQATTIPELLKMVSSSGKATTPPRTPPPLAAHSR